MIDTKAEALYLIDNRIYLHLQEADDHMSVTYAAYDKTTGEAMLTGEAEPEDKVQNPAGGKIAQARTMAINAMGIKGEIIYELPIRTLSNIKAARRSYLKHHTDAEKDHSIRFITSNYNELFRIKDGSRVKVEYPDRSFLARCEYIDDYHMNVGDTVFHICQFAEILERGGGSVSPEPVVTDDRAAWQIAHREYLTISTEDNAYKYSIYSMNFDEREKGVVNRPDITIQKCRDLILEERGWLYRNLCDKDYDLVEERAGKAAEKSQSVSEKLKENVESCKCVSNNVERAQKKGKQCRNNEKQER